MNKIEKINDSDQCSDAHEHAICPMVLVQRILSGKRKILILWYLSHQVLRFSELKRDLPDVTQKMLTLQLRSLEEDKLIYRKVYPVIPPKVEYGLTEAGKKIIPILEMMHQFGAKYLQAGLYEKDRKIDGKRK
ncbi:MAG: putative transcriptional regulator [Massilibacillus sp.]|jgi:DNA-binding HxlR family transcriptional regulator|nr:putative transcriptional regulator [Massilibacillus sp.]